MKTKRLSAIFSAALISVSSILAVGIVPLASATTNTCTWTGSGGNSNFSTAANWSGCNSAAPLASDNDNLVFDSTGQSVFSTLNNDISGLIVTNITFQGSGSNGFELTGLPLTLKGTVSDTKSGFYNTDTIALDITLGADVTITTKIHFAGLSFGSYPTLNLNGHNITINIPSSSSDNFADLGTITGSGNISSNAGVGIAASPNWTGALNLTGTRGVTFRGPLPSTVALTVADGGLASFCNTTGSPITMAGPLTIGGNGGGNGAIVSAPCSGGAAATYQFDSDNDVTWSGPITLTSNTTVGGNGEFKVTGALSGGFTLSMADGQPGKVTVTSSSNQSSTTNGVYPSQTRTTSYSGNQPNQSITVYNNNIATVDGTYGDSEVGVGAVINGNGTVNSLLADAGGTVAPGHSPGTITVVTTLTLASGSTYQAQLKDTTAGDFDQIVVGSASDTTGNDVSLGDGTPSDGLPTLDTELYSGANIKAGDTFKVINNLSKTPVLGTFNNLPEGATFKVGSGVFKISYVGGDGNDVVLTAVTGVTAPNTGFALMSSHPGATLAITVLAAGTIFGLAKSNRRKPAPARAKASRRR